MTRPKRFARQNRCSTTKALPHKTELINIEIKQPALLAAALAATLALDGTGIMRIGILCAVLHEIGHVLAFRLLVGHWPGLQIGFGEIRMKMRNVLVSPRKELIIASAGVFVNLLHCLTALFLMESALGYSYRGCWFAAGNILLACVNLLPVGGLDGAHIIAAAKEMIWP